MDTPQIKQVADLSIATIANNRYWRYVELNSAGRIARCEYFNRDNPVPPALQQKVKTAALAGHYHKPAIKSAVECAANKVAILFEAPLDLNGIYYSVGALNRQVSEWLATEQ